MNIQPHSGGSSNALDGDRLVPCPPLMPSIYPRPSSSGDRVVAPRQNLLLVAELTRRCNLRCVHCYADAGPNNVDDSFMTLQRWKLAFNWGQRSGYRHLQLIGGEPTLHPDFPALLDYGDYLGFDIEVFSNGISRKNTIRSVLARIAPRMAFSIYGARAQDHDRITKVRGSFAATLDSLTWCVQHALRVRVAVISVVDRDDFESVRVMLETLGIRDVARYGVQPVGRGTSLVAAAGRAQTCGLCGDGMVCVTASGEVYACIFSRSAALGRAGEGCYAEMLTPA